MLRKIDARGAPRSRHRAVELSRALAGTQRHPTISARPCDARGRTGSRGACSVTHPDKIRWGESKQLRAPAAALAGDASPIPLVADASRRE